MTPFTALFLGIAIGAAITFAALVFYARWVSAQDDEDDYF